MVFSSLPFLFTFLPIVLLACWLLPDRCRNAVLLLANLIFYAYGEPIYVLLMIASIAVNYGFALLIERSGRPGAKKLLLWITVILNLAGLIVFKYTGMLADLINAVAGTSFTVSIRLPIGISFYTFQAMSYVIDVYRGQYQAERNLVGFAAYISLFPQLIAGPIVRYSDVKDQLRGPLTRNLRPSMGVRLFVVGLSKKILLANQLGLLWDAVSANPETAGALGAWLGIAAYSLQLYFDFSGYSDMARGLGYLMGFEFCINFDYPYISKSITEFWRRWHISLSSWFRDYVYYPLGGSRCTVPRMCVNLLITWMLTGLWHGAGLNFLFWGLYYGVLLILEKLLWGKALKRLPAVIQHIYTLVIVMIGWVFFASESFGAAWTYLKVMFSVAPGSVSGGILSWLPLLAAACAAATPLGSRLWSRLGQRKASMGWEAALSLLGMILCTAALVSESYNPFLYFRF